MLNPWEHLLVDRNKWVQCGHDTVPFVIHMNNKELKQIELSPLGENPQYFRLESADGRDLLAKQIETDIDEWCQKQYKEEPRTHLGASIIGHNCERFIWFGFRWMFKESITGRQQRLFQRGHLEEARIIEYLNGIGFTVYAETVEGKQYHIVFGEGHGGGSLDGVVELPTRYDAGFPQPPLLLEMKTANHKQFAPIKDSGMIKAKPKHFAQASIYGRQRNIQYCLYICASKNDDDLDIEIIELDWGLADAEITKGERIINLQYPPPRISNNPSYFECKWCPANAVCHLGASIPVNCRSCRHAEAMPNKAWQCNLHHASIPLEFMPIGCKDHQPLTR